MRFGFRLVVSLVGKLSLTPSSTIRTLSLIAERCVYEVWVSFSG